VEHNRVERARVAEALRARGLEVLPSLAKFLFVDTGRDGAAVFKASGLARCSETPIIATWADSLPLSGSASGSG
jgi:histidinol-phosphate/aromatic aminotransferase/cobyric acid decarboxylase-like protein